MFFPLTSVWKMVKEDHNHILENIIGYAHTPCEINNDSISLYYR